MGRKRRADRDEIIDAVGLVVREHGLDGLSIEAVAKAAGIGKASVLYDFKSKDALLTAFVERKIRLHGEAVAEIRERHVDGPDATMRALLEYLGGPLSQDDLASGMLVAAAASRNEGFRAFLRDTFAEEISRVEAEAGDPPAALTAYFALHGLLSLECFGFCQIDGDRRRRTLAEIARMMNVQAAAAPADSEPDSPEFSRKNPEFSRKSKVST